MAYFRKLPSGNWQANVYVNDNYVTLGTFKTKAEAKVKANKAENKVYFNEVITDRNILFSEVIDKWYLSKKDQVKLSTYRQIKVIKTNHINKHLGHKKLFKITKDDVEEWLNNFEGYSYQSKRRYFITLKEIFNYAIYNLEILNRNPAEKVKLAKQEVVKIKRTIKYYTLDDLNVLLDFLSEYKPQRFSEYNVYYILVYFLSRTGLRISEALALKWSDIDQDRLDINKQTSRDDNNNLAITTLKTTSSYRNIEIDQQTINLLKQFRKTQNKMILKHKNFKRNKDMIIFQNFFGHYMTPSTIRDSLKNYCFLAGVDYKGTHSFRHTHAVLSLEAGADLLYISRRLGHNSIQTTADIYLDITPQYASSELSKIASHLNSTSHEVSTTAKNEK